MTQDAADAEDALEYTVVVNHEEQYSIWPVGRELPSGWRAIGVQGTKESCLEHIARAWTDMRPLSVRQRMDGDDSGH